ncbi:hypothetical protein H0H81_002700 [Sphagnurus paluster]|uniref:Uncharacterized protein n=1 Tax=Sphagnurus paluster TaxID=117069 RepID=A0A9P7KJT9_9AGAR|nr:hypothetical protein H0H81_002700 [Sphagnurus paluster]
MVGAYSLPCETPSPFIQSNAWKIKRNTLCHGPRKRPPNKTWLKHDKTGKAVTSLLNTKIPAIPSNLTALEEEECATDEMDQDTTLVDDLEMDKGESGVDDEQQLDEDGCMEEQPDDMEVVPTITNLVSPVREPLAVKGIARLILEQSTPTVSISACKLADFCARFMQRHEVFQCNNDCTIKIIQQSAISSRCIHTKFETNQSLIQTTITQASEAEALLQNLMTAMSDNRNDVLEMFHV